MATAREVLCSEVLALLTPSFIGERKVILEAVDKYRIQAKPHQNVPEDATARELLVDGIMEIYADENPEKKHRLELWIDNFRMQYKQAAGGQPNEEKTPKKTTRSPSRRGGTPSSETGLSEEHKLKSLLDMGIDNEEASPSYEPIGGGPVKRKSIRGECPKCHSAGVVLARSYTGDEYFSCIYCGFQSFRGGIEAELDLPLATELLQRKFHENDTDED